MSEISRIFQEEFSDLNLNGSEDPLIWNYVLHEYILLTSPIFEDDFKGKQFKHLYSSVREYFLDLREIQKLRFKVAL